MPHTIKLAATHFAGLKPRTPAERRSLRNILLIISASFFCVTGVWQLQVMWSNHRHAQWSAAIATIEDVRPALVTKVDGARGSAMLYRAEVLVRFSTPSGTEEQWVGVRQRPQLLEDIQFERFRWKGATCTVRWNPSNPSQIDAEIN